MKGTSGSAFHVWGIGLALLPMWAIAADPFGSYIGLAVGHATVRVDDQINFGPVAVSRVPFEFSQDHNAWKGVVGFRPISEFGAELEYVDFGQPAIHYIQNSFKASSQVHTTSIAAFALGFLPLPVPHLDIYGKLGVARVREAIGVGAVTSFLCPGGNQYCSSYSVIQGRATLNQLAYGAGTQWKFGDFALRAEYEQFGNHSETPDLVSIGLNWMF